MRQPAVLLLVIILMFGFFACKNEGSQGSDDALTVDSTEVERHLAQLASDEFLGRKPFTEGETKTIAYLQSELEKMGLEPGNNGSYFQEVPLVEISPMPDSTMKVVGPSGSFDLKIKDDYVLYTQREQEDIQIKDAELVFCGYGIVAPEYNWNDYADIDMKGKIAVVMVNDPGFQNETQDSTFFKGNIMTYYGRWTYKYEEAARQGAEGVLIIHETNAAGYPWFVPRGSMSPRLNLQTPNGGADKCAIQGWVTLTAAAELFKASGIKEGRFFEKAKTPGFKPIPLGVKISTNLKNQLKKDVSQNVVAMIRGSERPDEAIIYSTHWDHLGVGQEVQGDSIYNGAVDNASGSAALLAIAKTFTELKQKPERTVVFLFVTAEEQGLLGSEYYALNPIFPKDKTVANINMDALNPNGMMKDLTVVGYGQSELDDYASEEAGKQGRYILPDQEPEKGFYFRSDHFNFAKVGIPALYASGGYDHITKGKEYARGKADEFTANNYHQPSDEYTPGAWELSGILQDAQLFFNIGKRLASEKTFPKWKEGSEFKSLRN
ncbi:MAG: M20/M25/M40 family metallo-hydrolase [Saprospiraceae bacterium]|nr:M20/M25/M40 family metallo-hydrolase [Saprospiraceae bacterium]